MCDTGVDLLRGECYCAAPGTPVCGSPVLGATSAPLPCPSPGGNFDVAKLLCAVVPAHLRRTLVHMLCRGGHRKSSCRRTRVLVHVRPQACKVCVWLLLLLRPKHAILHVEMGAHG